MVPTPASRLLFKQAHAAAEELGWPLRETTVGGASDGNLVSALGGPSSTAWARWATAPTHGTSTSCRTIYRYARRCWRGSSWRERCSRTRLSNLWTPSRGLA
ncbi:hypothetical protein [Streptomyces coeruleorubidus]